MIPVYPFQIRWNRSWFHYVAKEGMHFCLVSDDNVQCGPLTDCKDYMQDGVHAYLNHLGCKNPGFEDARHPPCTDKLKLAFGDPETMEADDIERALDYIWKVERKLRVQFKTTIFRVPNNPPYFDKIYLAVATPRWVRNPVMLSFFTLLLRTSSIHQKGESVLATLKRVEDGEWTSQDQGIVEDAMPGIRHILQYGDFKIFGRDIKKNYGHHVDLSDMHCYGIGGYGSGLTEDDYPRWHRLRGHP